MMSDIDRIIQSRSKLVSNLDISYKKEEEGGCGSQEDAERQKDKFNREALEPIDFRIDR